MSHVLLSCQILFTSRSKEIFTFHLKVKRNVHFSPQGQRKFSFLTPRSKEILTFDPKVKRNSHFSHQGQRKFFTFSLQLTWNVERPCHDTAFRKVALFLDLIKSGKTNKLNIHKHQFLKKFVQIEHNLATIWALNGSPLILQSGQTYKNSWNNFLDCTNNNCETNTIAHIKDFSVEGGEVGKLPFSTFRRHYNGKGENFLFSATFTFK